ncbi:Rho GTPase [Hypoxylon texense]
MSTSLATKLYPAALIIPLKFETVSTALRSATRGKVGFGRLVEVYPSNVGVIQIVLIAVYGGMGGSITLDDEQYGGQDCIKAMQLFYMYDAETSLRLLPTANFKTYCYLLPYLQYGGQDYIKAMRLLHMYDAGPDLNLLPTANFKTYCNRMRLVATRIPSAKEMCLPCADDDEEMSSSKDNEGAPSSLNDGVGDTGSTLASTLTGAG